MLAAPGVRGERQEAIFQSTPVGPPSPRMMRKKYRLTYREENWGNSPAAGWYSVRPCEQVERR